MSPLEETPAVNVRVVVFPDAVPLNLGATNPTVGVSKLFFIHNHFLSYSAPSNFFLFSSPILPNHLGVLFEWPKLEHPSLTAPSA